MHAYPRWKFWLILGVLLVSIMGSMPNVVTPPTWWPASLSKAMNLGLDLKGGVHLVLDVDVNKAVQHTVEEDVDTARQALRGAHILYRSLETKGTSLDIIIKDPGKATAFWRRPFPTTR